jgi:hypothetical protein
MYVPPLMSRLKPADRRDWLKAIDHLKKLERDALRARDPLLFHATSSTKLKNLLANGPSSYILRPGKPGLFEIRPGLHFGTVNTALWASEKAYGDVPVILSCRSSALLEHGALLPDQNVVDCGWCCIGSPWDHRDHQPWDASVKFVHGTSWEASLTQLASVAWECATWDRDIFEITAPIAAEPAE